jgi:hypothetical protein
MPCGFDKYFRTLSGVGPACTVRVRTPEHFVLHYEHFVFTFRTVLYCTQYRTTCGLTPQLVLALSVARFTAAGVQDTLRSSGQGLTGVQDQESGQSSLSLN